MGSRGESSNQTWITNGSTASGANGFSDSGAVYIYEKVGSLWQQTAYIKPSNANSGYQFGSSVSLSGTQLAVGSPFESSNQVGITNGSTASSDTSMQGEGAVYIFEKAGLTWQQTAYIKDSCPAMEFGTYFGFSVSLSGNHLVVGDPGEGTNSPGTYTGAGAPCSMYANYGGAYVFLKLGGNWVESGRLKAPYLGAGDAFGLSVAIHGNRMVVGAMDEDGNSTTIINGTSAVNNDNSPASGAAYVFSRFQSNYIQEAYLKPSNSDPGDNFGYSVDVYGNYVLVGAPKERAKHFSVINGGSASNNNSYVDAGAAYLFECVDGQ